MNIKGYRCIYVTFRALGYVWWQFLSIFNVFWALFVDSFLNCIIIKNKKLKLEIQNYEIDFFHIGSYKADIAQISQNELISPVKKKQHFFHSQNLRKIKHRKCAIHLWATFVCFRFLILAFNKKCCFFLTFFLISWHFWHMFLKYNFFNEYDLYSLKQLHIIEAEWFLFEIKQ